MLNRILAVLQITLLDGIRRHALLGLFALGMLAEVSGLLFTDFFGRDIGRAACDYAFSIMWLIGLCFLFFHAVHSSTWDNEKKSIYLILSRPISRTEYILGLFLGLALLLIILQFMLGLSALTCLYLIKSSVLDIYFTSLSLPYFIISWCGLILMQLCLLSVILLFSSLIRGSVVVSMVSLAYYAICSALPVIRSFSDNESTTISNLFTFLTLIFPNLSRLDFKDSIVSNSLIPATSIPYNEFILALSYCFLILSISRIIYQKRDIY